VIPSCSRIPQHVKGGSCRPPAATQTIIVKRNPVLPALTLALLASFDAPAAGRLNNKCDLKISSSSLDNALQEVGRQCQVQILYFAQITAGKTASRVEGEYAIDEALNRLLESTGLSFRRVNANTLEIKPAAAAASSAADSQVRRRAAEKPPGSGMQEVLITGTAEDLVATRVETPVREIPQSITILSSEQIRQQGNLNVLDAVADAVGITIARRSTNALNLRARGFSIGSYTIDGGGGLRSVSHTPGIPVLLLTPDLAGFERVEVLRGSNALFGADAAPGGAINLVRKRPSDEFGVRFSASAGSWQNYRQELDATGPLAGSGALRGRLVVSNASQDYFYKHAHDERQSLFGVLDVDLTDSTLLTVGGSYSKTRSRPFDRGLLRFTDGTDPRVPRDTSYTFDYSRFDTRVAEGFLRLEQELGSQTRLRINATLIDNKVTYLLGGHMAQLNPVTRLAARASAQYTLEPYTQTQLNLEATFTGHGEWWGGRRVEWVFGGDYLNADSDTYTAQAPAHGPPIDPYNFDPALYPYPVPNVTPLPLATANVIDTRIGGLFASVRLEITQPWSVTMGLRRTDETISDDIVYYWSGRGFPQLRDYHYKNVLTPYVGTLFNLNGTWSLYASYADIFGSNTNLIRSDSSLLPPSRGVTLEGGVKGAWRDGTLNGSLAIFKVVRRDLPARDAHAVPTVSNCCWTTLGRHEAKGVDVELSGYLASQWIIGAGYTFNQLKEISPAAAGSAAIDTTPRHLLKVWTDYRLPGTWNRWTVGGSLHAQSTVAPKALRFEQKSYAVVSPRVAYRSDARWQVALTVNNLFDKHYYDSFNELWYGEPRNYFVRMDAQF